MTPHEQQIKRLVEAIFDVHQDGGMDCDSCSMQFECLVELVANGTELRELLPAVEAHLRCCTDCREEFQALTAIIRAEQSGLTTFPS